MFSSAVNFEEKLHHSLICLHILPMVAAVDFLNTKVSSFYAKKYHCSEHTLMATKCLKSFFHQLLYIGGLSLCARAQINSIA